MEQLRLEIALRLERLGKVQPDNPLLGIISMSNGTTTYTPDFWKRYGEDYRTHKSRSIEEAFILYNRDLLRALEE